jgi:signal transduction histidine kinase
MKVKSFRYKIIGVVILVVCLVSVLGFSIFNLVLRKKLFKHKEYAYNEISLLKNQFYFTIDHHDGRIIKSMLENLKDDKDIIQAYLINSDNKITFPANYLALGDDTSNLRTLISQNKEISIKTIYSGKEIYDRVFIKLNNTAGCQSCHDNSRPTLGMIVIDMKNSATAEIIQLSRQFSLFYTIGLLIAIFLLVLYLHYKYIRKSIKQFRSTITLINEGHIEARMGIPEVSELGSLGRDFNEMLDTFEKAKIQLEDYHRKEMQNTQKLATIGEMSSRIAHEIRNPITGIASAMEIIIEELNDTEKKPILEEIQRQARRVNQAILNLLKYSRSRDINPVMGDLNELIRSLVFFLKNQAHDKDIEIELELSDAIPRFPFDSEQIENVLMNLIMNAIDVVPDPGLIRFKSSYDTNSRMVSVSVVDNGHGIDNEVGEDIFKPFFTTKTKGTGLGLAISKDIIEKHQGYLAFQNLPGTGCIFTFSIPV